MPTPFDSFGYVEATQTVRRSDTSGSLTPLMFNTMGAGVADSAARPVNLGGMTQLIRAMLDGDMWLGGFGWIGPRPQPTDDGYSETLRLLHQGFISENALAEVIDRHVAGVLGREPQWGFAVRRHIDNDQEPTDEEQTLIGEAEALVTQWWDARKLHKFLNSATRTLLYARRSVVRLYVPQGKIVSENVTDPQNPARVKTVKVVPRVADVPAGLAFVWPDGPMPELSTVSEDPDTKESIGVVLYRAGQNVMGTGGSREIAELTYLAEPNAGGDALTIIRQASTGQTDVTVRLNFGGRLSMYEMTRAPFVTTQMIQLQRALNLALTALPKNVIQAGWLERVIANAQMPGKWVSDANAAGGKKWVPDKHVTGGGATTYLRGLKQEDLTTGSVSYATPTVNWREPSPVAPTVEAQEALYRGILREAKQEHTLMSQDVKASGKSREQARSDFEMTLRPTAAEVNALGRWLLETALAMAEAFSFNFGKYTNTLRATFDCQIDTGPITDLERTAIDGSVTAGTLSRETAMSLEGIADPAAEIARINAQPGADLEIVTKQLAAIAAAATAGLDIEGAAIAVGMDPKVAKKLVPQFTAPELDENGKPIPPKPGDDTGGDPASEKGAKPASAGALPGGGTAG